MAKDYASQGDFGDIENRLRNLLSLLGAIPLTLEEKVSPVVIVGDGTQPGMSGRGGFRGRTFFVNGCQLVGVTGAAWGVKNTYDDLNVIFDRIWFRNNSAGAVNFALNWAGSAFADPMAFGPGSGADSYFLDRVSGLRELTAVTVGLSTAAPAGLAQGNLVAFPMNAGESFEIQGLVLSPGCKFWGGLTAIGNLSVVATGRVL